MEREGKGEKGNIGIQETKNTEDETGKLILSPGSLP